VSEPPEIVFGIARKHPGGRSHDIHSCLQRANTRLFHFLLKSKVSRLCDTHFHFKTADIFSLVSARLPQAQSQCSDGNIVLARLLG